MEEGGLTRNISILRKALGEKPDDHQYIVTVPGRGDGSSRMCASERDEPSRGDAVAQDEVQLESAPAVTPLDDFAVTRSHDSVERLAPVAQVAAAADESSSIRRWLLLGGLAALVAGGLAYALRPTHAANGERPLITAIAVLPLANLSGDPSREDLRRRLPRPSSAISPASARCAWSHVLCHALQGRGRATHQDGANTERRRCPRRIGPAQRRPFSNQRPIDPRGDYAHLWAREYERELTDVLKLQSDVARAVVDEVQARVTAEERARLASAGSVNPAAYLEFLLGQHYLWRLTEEDLARAIVHFEESLRVDPSYAASYAGLSHAWWWRGIGRDDVQAGRIALPCSRREGAEACPRPPRSACVDGSPQLRARVGLERRQAGVHTCPRDRSQ